MRYRIFASTSALLCAVTLILAAPASAQRFAVPPTQAALPIPEGGCPISQTESNSAIGLTLGFNEAVGQSFTAPCDGEIVAISFDISAVLTVGTLDMTVYEGAGDTGAVIGTGLVNVTTIGAYTVTFDPGLSVTEGGVYTFKLTITAGQSTSVNISESSLNPYAGGTEYNIAFGGGGTVFGSDPNYDLVFTVDIQPTATECDLKYLAADLTYNAGTRRLCATVTVRNNGDAPRTARLVLDYNRNGGPPQGSKTLGSGTLPGGAQATRTICLRVPGNAPDGDYNFDLRLVDVATGSDCGSYTETIAISAPRVGDAAVGGDFEVEAVADLSPAADAAAPATARAMVTASPNPAREGATLHYTLPAAADVRLAVYDALGREVAVLAEGRAEAGAHAAVLDARALPAGVYVYRLTVDGRTEAGRLTVVE